MNILKKKNRKPWKVGKEHNANSSENELGKVETVDIDREKCLMKMKTTD